MVQPPNKLAIKTDTNTNAQLSNIQYNISKETKIVLDQLPNFSLIIHSNVLYINKIFQHYLGLTSDNFQLKNFLKFLHPKERKNFSDLVKMDFFSESSIQQQYRIKNKDNKYLWFLMQAKPHLNETHTFDWSISFIDVEQYHQIHQEVLLQLKIQKEQTLQTKNALRTSTEIDKLTGLLNRNGLKSHIAQLFKKTEMQKLIGLYLIGLDHFKNINDTQGYAAGDFILKTFAKRLKKALPPKTIVARLGSDEFAIVYHDIPNIDDFMTLGNKILKLIDAPFNYQGKVLNSSMSIGCSMFPQDADSFSNLLQCADTALSDLKARGRGGIQYFNENMFNITRNKAIQIETARRIIHEKSIKPYYQPKVELNTLKVIGLEALLRWHCPETHIMFKPETITEAFDDFELSTKISAVMQNKIFLDIKKWQAEGKRVVPIAINASPVEFFRDNYAETLLNRMKKSEISPELIEIEITEHLFSDRGIDFVRRALNKLQNAGIKISLDDFGTGHSSLTHLRDLPVNTIKVDYSFIKKITYEKPIAAIVEGIVKLGPLLNMNVIAEGIENQEQLDILIKMGCPQGQGFLFQEAITSSEVARILD